jgi:hypothetical protein
MTEDMEYQIIIEEAITGYRRQIQNEQNLTEEKATALIREYCKFPDDTIKVILGVCIVSKIMSIEVYNKLITIKKMQV